MGKFAEYEAHDALGLAELVAGGDITPAELLDEAVERAERLNPKLNAITQKHYDEARARIVAGLPDGPFKGVPFLLKDLHLLLKGTITSFGSRLFKDVVADHNSTLTDRYLDAGLVVFGKTNTPEFGLSGTTEPRQFGPTRNPWDTSLSAGGSSGGAGAAVSAGIVPMAHASDGGGSIRIPASACGLFGMKPTRARTPTGPDRGEGWAGMSISHALSRTVRDSAALLDATHGLAPGDPYDAPARLRPWLEEVSRDPGRLRIAFRTTRPDGTLPHPDVAAALHEAAQLCESLGHGVEEASVEIADVREFSRHQMAVISANAALMFSSVARMRGRAVTPEDVEKITWRTAQRGQSITGEQYAAATVYIQELGRRFGEFLETYDVFLCPTLGESPFPLGALDMMTDDVDAYVDANRRLLPYTALFNMTGQPSMSVPLGRNSAGLPIGIMFTAQFGREDVLFRLAGQLEKTAPWPLTAPGGG